MTFNDLFKSSFMENIASFSPLDMAIAMGLAFALGVFIFFVYKKTYIGIMYSAGFGVSLLGLTLITTFIILAVTSNIILSLGMVGALSIVRFRTAIKEPLDIVFLFWSIAAGIVLGAGLLPLAILGSLFIGIILVVFVNRKSTDAPYILIVVSQGQQQEDEVLNHIKNGVKITNVGVRPKGNSSLSMVAKDYTTDRYSFKIEFDHYVSGQTWLGLDKIVVNNMQGDSTYMKEYLSYDIMEYAGVDTPLYAFSNIAFNGQTWGFYLAVEALEDSYAARIYGADHGKLYKPESMGMRGHGEMNEFVERMQDGGFEENFPDGFDGNFPGAPGNFYDGNGGENRMRQEGVQGRAPGAIPEQAQGEIRNRMPDAMPGGGFGSQSGGTTLQYTDDEISSYSSIFENAVFKSTDSDYKRIISSLKKLNAGEDFESAVDVDATLKYFAAHTVIVNLDSYISNMGHNYYLYEKDGQLTMLPWDFNLAFGGFQSGNASSIVNFPIDTPVSGVSLEDRPILGKLLEVPEYLDMYHGYFANHGPQGERFNGGGPQQAVPMGVDSKPWIILGISSLLLAAGLIIVIFYKRRGYIRP